MQGWRRAIREGLIAGSVASIVSTAALLWFGRRETPRSTAPVNAISHWIWGDVALHEDGPTLRHTATGYTIHHLASIFWGVLHARAWGDGPRAKEPLGALASAAATSAVACFVDYRLTPRRLTPGFEHRLSRTAMAGVYASFALGLAIGSVLAVRRGR